MQKKHAHIILEEEKATLNLCTKFSNTHLKIFRTVIIFIYHARHRDGSSRINEYTRVINESTRVIY